MSKAKDIRNFFYSQYFSDGLRLAFGTIVPALVFSFFGSLKIGIIVSLGAMAVGLSDTPGPAHHRRNGMFFSTLSVIISALITTLVSGSPILLAITVIALSFVFSMFSVYGARASSVGTMGILIMVLSISAMNDSSMTVAHYLLYVLAGCIWYMVLSFSLHQVRPYRQAQQELAESILNVADFIRLKANFYSAKTDIDKNYRALIDQQITISAHQDNVRDQLFRGKRKIKDTTEIGRLLILLFTDIVDLFEQSMATHYDYEAVRKQFGPTGVLQQFYITIQRIGNELEHLSYEINANKKPKALYNFKTDLERIRTAIDEVEKTYPMNVLPLRKILINIRNLVQRIDSLYGYFDLKARNSVRSEETDLGRFIEHTHIDFKKIRENLTLKSNLFRHSLRMALVMGIGYAISLTFDVGTHSYWILLTIMVILKPGFGLTKERNFQRLLGTVIGGIIGAVLLLTIKDETSLFILLLIFMVSTFSLMRVNYVVSVIVMTPYVLILFSFLGMDTLSILQERVIDTLIGSGLAFLSSYVILPNWESVQVYGTMRKLLIANYQYIAQALKIIAGQPPTVTEYKLARKEVYITTANMASAFQRMMTEPKSKRRGAKDINRFVVFNHMLSSYSVTLLNNVQGASDASLTGEQIKVIRITLSLLARSIQLFEKGDDDPEFTEIEVETPPDIDDNNIESEELRLITDQLQFLRRLAADLQKVCTELHKQPAIAEQPVQ